MHLRSAVLKRLMGTTEVLLVFCLVHLAYRLFKQTSWGRLESEWKLLFSMGFIMALATIALVKLRGGRPKDYGLIASPFLSNLKVGLFFLTMFLLVGAALVGLGFPLRPQRSWAGQRSVLRGAGYGVDMRASLDTEAPSGSSRWCAIWSCHSTASRHPRSPSACGSS